MSKATCDIPAVLLEEFKKFRISKDCENSAFIMKVDLKSDPPAVVLEEIQTQVKIEDVASDLSESQPRYLVYSYKYTRADGRTSFPLMFIFYCPRELHPRTAMIYSSTKTPLINKLEITKVWDVQSADALTEAELLEKLAFWK
eukprot:TRINITY_DN352_c0_g1_i1.p1 TRINITY_DN352_c0_g1~~TRINITY_DN352_c0_g1_i1.p1  ORF type:complete len:143 (+),score=38.21 TRINITY_DN352_c0_g1_i1:71-499(+)